ncbi:MAG: hypothetical protein RLZZ330_331 [Actinomycetota bacterium]|jgi:signal peptidase I
MKTISRISISILKLVALVLMLYSVSLLGLRLLGFEFSVVMSNSMNPAVRTGDLVVLDKHDEYFVGEIIQYQYHEIKVLHRIVQHKKSGYRTRGDANQAADPLLVAQHKIDGVAIGSLRGFGLPILLFRNLSDSIFSAAKFTNLSTWQGKAGSNIWINPTAKWKTLNLNDPFIFAPPSGVTSFSSGSRTVLISKVNFYDKYFYSSLRLTTKDPSNASVSLLADACTASGLLTCGWAIALSDTLNTISVSTYSSNGSQNAVLLQKSYPIDLSIATKMILYSSSDALRLFINDIKAIEILNPAAYAQLKGLAAPSGNYFGIAVAATNQFKSSKTATW